MISNKRMMFATAVIVFSMTLSVGAQTPADPQTAPQKARPRTATTGEQEKDKKAQKPVVTGDRLEPDDATRTPSDVSPEMQANRQEVSQKKLRSILTTTTSSAPTVWGRKTSSRLKYLTSHVTRARTS